MKTIKELTNELEQQFTAVVDENTKYKELIKKLSAKTKDLEDLLAAEKAKAAEYDVLKAKLSDILK